MTLKQIELIAELQRVAKDNGLASMSFPVYRKHGGQYCSSTFDRYLNGWNKALELAGLPIVKKQAKPKFDYPEGGIKPTMKWLPCLGHCGRKWWTHAGKRICKRCESRRAHVMEFVADGWEECA